MAVAWQVRGDFDDPIYLPGVVESLPETKVVSVEDGVPEGWMGLDIGPASITAFQEVRQGFVVDDRVVRVVKCN